MSVKKEEKEKKYCTNCGATLEEYKEMREQREACCERCRHK